MEYSVRDEDEAGKVSTMLSTEVIEHLEYCLIRDINKPPSSTQFEQLIIPYSFSISDKEEPHRHLQLPLLSTVGRLSEVPI
jgi:hypothetical protein